MPAVHSLNSSEVANQKRGKLFQMRIDQELSDLANKQAAKKGISLAGYIRMLILADIEKDKPTA